MYRVVMDRDRWFKVVIGEKYKVDAKTTEKLAERIPLLMDIPKSYGVGVKYYIIKRLIYFDIRQYEIDTPLISDDTLANSMQLSNLRGTSRSIALLDLSIAINKIDI